MNDDDPIRRAVRVSLENLAGRSVTAVTAAADEVGHALQHRDGDPVLVARTRWRELCLLPQWRLWR
jgi:Zn-dependent membrane protease YugP